MRLIALRLSAAGNRSSSLPAERLISMPLRLSGDFDSQHKKPY
jgi:hypothetical protein